jgi:hypothetical protein
MSMKKNLLYALTALLQLLVFVSESWAQDPQFTQIYSSPLYLNPAFAGNLDYDCRKLTASRFKTMVNYRSQYNGDFSTLYGTIDYKDKTDPFRLTPHNLLLWVPIKFL